MPLSRRVLLAAVVLCAAPAMPGVPGGAPPELRPERPILPAAAAPVEPMADHEAAAGPAEPDVTTPPARPASVPTRRVALRVEDVTAVRDTLRQVRRHDAVAHATVVRRARLAVAGAPAGTELVVAAVDTDAFRRLAPQVVADTVGVWDRLDEGAIAVTHEHAGRLGLQLGGDLQLGGQHAVPVRVGAFATNGVPPVAEAIVDRATGARLGLDEVPATVLVALRDDASAATIAAQLEEQVGREVTVVPDPRAPAPTPASPTPPQGDTVWDLLAMCESSGNWHANTGNGYYGGLQFLPESWWMVGGTGMPHEATREEQILRAERLQGLQGWKAWPVCSVRVGLRPGPPFP